LHQQNLPRYDESASGRLVGGINTYAYVGGNPLSRTDRNGLLWEYSQSQGTLWYFPPEGGAATLISTGGYAGNGVYLNDGTAQGRSREGPLPVGTYTIEDQRFSRNTGAAAMPLTPDPGNNTFGRSSFQIHGDNGRGDRSASEGCIIKPRSVRDLIQQSTDRVLRVVP
jgi:hypothetical protein